jgi:hypothetical protein
MTQNSGPIGSATRAMSQGSSAAIEVDLAQQRECFVDANTGAPQHDDQPAQPPAVQTVAGDAHDRDDLLDGRRIGWIAQALVARRMTRVKPRASPPATVDGRRHQQRRIRTWALPQIRPAAEQESADRASSTIRRTPASATERKRRAPPHHATADALLPSHGTR